MRVIERSEFRDEEGEISLENRVRGTLRFGLSWYGDMEAQEQFSVRLQRHLSDEHLLLRNAQLPGTDLIVPLILLSPQGVRTIVASSKKGIFRAKKDQWYSFSRGARRFQRARPNMQALAIANAQAVHSYLQSQGVPLPEVEPVLAFTDPKTHVDSANPEVRIVQADAFDHFATNLQKYQPIMDQEDIRELTGLILDPPKPEPVVEEIPEEIIEETEVERSSRPRPPAADEVDPFRLEDSPAARQAEAGRLNFSRSQWLLLGLLALMNLLIIIVFAALIFSNSLL
jgi:hypothetical protein